MAKVFVFCIGGTGIRVLKSITMLAASGMKTNGYQVVPIIIDPHVDLEEKTRVDNLVADYSRIYDFSTKDGDNRLEAMPGFFNTQFIRLTELDGQSNGKSENQAERRSFGDYINSGNLNNGDVNNYFIKTIFSEENLKNSLAVGFKGNPNVGTVVLNEMVGKSSWYESFLRHFEKDDRVFIISSIFGGTGASGYPLIEKKVRDAQSYPNVRNSIMGAVTVLPYYALDDPENSGSDIDSSNFYTKTKAALSYYEKSVKSDYLYYVGEQTLRAIYKNDEKVQKDSANFIELVAASALFDFLKRAKPDSPQALTRAIREDSDAVELTSLGDGYNDIVRCVSTMMLMQTLVSDLRSEKQFPLKLNWKIDSDFYEDQSFVSLSAFCREYENWYRELSSNQRSFAPLNLVDVNGDFTNWVKGKTLKGKDISYYLLQILNISNSTRKTHDNAFRYFMEFLYSAITFYTKNI